MAIFEITMLFVGSIIGAGFATGAEIMTFFGQLNLPAWLIASMVGAAMLTIISLSILITTHRQQNSRVNLITITLYFILFTAMTAGITQIAGIIVSLLALILSTGIVLFGFEHLTKINNLMVLVIIAVLFSTCCTYLNLPVSVHTTWTNLPQLIFWALLYAGLNCFMFPEIIKAAAQKHTRRQLYWAGLITAIIIAIFVGLIIHTIYATNTQNTTMPLLSAANHHTLWIIILFAMLTSQYSSLFAITQRLTKNNTKNTRQHTAATIFIVSAAAFGCSFFGFKSILNYTYPMIGTITCFSLFYELLAWLVARFWQHHQ